MRQSQLGPALLGVDDTPSIPELLMHTLRSLVPYDVVPQEETGLVRTAGLLRSGGSPAGGSECIPMSCYFDLAFPDVL